MPHWEQREEPRWSDFRFNQPYAKGLARLREVMATTDFDPATLWQWGTMQATAVIEILKACELAFGAAGQQVVYRALREVGRDIGHQILEGTAVPEGMGPAEYISFFATVINRIAYASLEEPRIDSEDRVSFDIRWCPHQDHYRAFDCRVQRYFVQGMVDALREHAGGFGEFDVRFDSTMPAGAPTCHFTIERGSGQAWAAYTEELDRKALERAAAQREAASADRREDRSGS